MWIVRWVIALLVIILAMWFGFANSDQTVTVNFWRYQIITPLIIALFVAFIVGALAWFPVAIIQYVQIKSEVRNLRKEKGKLQAELSDLRNISIEDDESSGEQPES